MPQGNDVNSHTQQQQAQQAAQQAAQLAAQQGTAVRIAKIYVPNHIRAEISRALKLGVKAAESKK